MLTPITYVQKLGLDPGSSSQYSSMYWPPHMPVHWTRPVYWWFRRSRKRSRRSCDPCPRRLVRGPRRWRPQRVPLEGPCRMPVLTRFGLKNTSILDPVFRMQFGSKLLRQKLKKGQKTSEMYDGQECAEIRHTAVRSQDFEKVRNGF